MTLTVSIIIPVYNAEEHLAESIESCLNQTYKDIEIIAVNDGSTDRSLDVLSQYSGRVHIISKENGGIASALNAGIDSMRGEWYKQMDADDMLHPDAVERLVLATGQINNPDTIVFMDQQSAYEDGRTFRHHMYLDNASSPFEQAVRLMCGAFFGSFHTSLVHASVLEKTGAYDESLKIAEDYDLALRMCMSGFRFHHVPQLIYTYRMHASQGTHMRDLEPDRRAIISRSLARLDGHDQKRYADAVKACLSGMSFRSGVWHYANRHRPAQNIDSKGGLAAASVEHPRLRVAYRTARFFATATRRRDAACVRGWLWAMRHGSSGEVVRAMQSDHDKYRKSP